LAPKNVQDQLRILYVGRIHPEKGVALLAGALRLLAEGKRKRETGDKGQGTGDWECVLVGPVAQSEGGGGEAFAAELKRQVEGLPVRFEAPVFDPEALAKIYDKADVFVYPSVAEIGESFGIAPLEAMARGLVPVVSDLAVFRQYIEPGVNGIVFDHRPATAPAQLAAAIDSLLQDPARRKAMAAKARQTAETYSLSATADRYLSLFAKITEEPR
jgi:glycosyltransferase involved in cell wall biosynthesis